VTIGSRSDDGGSARVTEVNRGKGSAPRRRRLLAGRALGACVGALVCAWAVTAAAGAGDPNTLYVDKANTNCSNTGSGTLEQPFCSIGKAASGAVAGQTVLVSSGTYSESLTPANSGTLAAPIVFAAAPGATVTITGANGVNVSGKNYVTVQGFDVTQTATDAIVVKNSSNIRIVGNRASYAGQPVSGKTAKGIRIDNATDSVVSGNTVAYDTSYGIYLLNGSTRNSITENVVFGNAFGYQRAASGIRVHTSPANTIASNISYDNEDSGIEFDKSNNNLVFNNVTYDNGDHGIDVTASSKAQTVVSNTVYRNVTAGINVEGTSTGAKLANNIAVDNGINSPRTHGNIRVAAGSTSGTTMDYNLVYLTVPDVMLIWNSTNYSSLSAFRSATGQEARGLQADPKWKSPASGDFHLLAGSPAIDSADSGASGQPSTDADGFARDDDPTTVNAGAGPRAYDDRGAYEFDAPEIAQIVIAPSTATVAAGASKTFTAEGFDSTGTSVGDVSSATTFSVAPDGSCTGSACTATVAGAHAVTATYGANTSTASLTVTAGTLDHLTLSPASASISSGGSQAYTAEGRDQYGNSLGDVTATTTFSISPNGSCTSTMCTASLAGAHSVTGTKGGKSGTAALDVVAGTPDHIVVSPSPATIVAGAARGYTAEGFDAAGNSVGDVTAFTTFSILPDGACTGSVCTATVAGPHTVTGNDAGKTSIASLAVTPGALDHLVLSPASATIVAGASRSYTAEGRDQYDNVVGDVTAGTTFTIAPDGSCSAGSCSATTAGPHTVTGDNAGKRGTASLTVTAGALDHLVLSPSSATITAGRPQAYAAEGRDQYDNSLGDGTASTTFTIAPDGSCATATCTPSEPGPHTVTGDVAGKTGTASLDVTAAIVDHIVVSPATATMAAGGSQAFTAEGFDAANTSLGDVTAATTFSIGPDGSCTGDVCTATVVGAHTVTGDHDGKTATAALTVSPGMLDHLALSPASSSIASGDSQSYTAEGRDQYDNSLGDVTASTTFTIAPNGSCTGADCTASLAGAHVVTGSYDGKTGTATLEVLAAGVDHIVVSPATATIAAGGSQAFTAEGFDAANTSLGDVTAATTFSIGPDGWCTGNVCTATVAGPHTVTGDDAGKTSTASLTVTAGPLDHLALSPASATIASGGTQAYTAEGRDQYDNSLGDVTTSTTFTIAPNGSCTGADCTASVVGAHTVTGKKTGKTGTASLNVTAGGELDHIVIRPTSATITAGGSQAYTAEGFDAANNSLGDVTAFTTFSTLPDGACTGNVCTATVAGAHTVTGNDAGKTSTASLTVTAGPLDHLALSPASATIASGGTQAYTAEARDQYGNPLGDVTASTTFTIAPDGSCAGATCTSSVVGSHTVTGTSGGKTGSASLQVGTGSLDRLVVSPAGATISAGGSQAYTATGFDAANNPLGDVTSSTTFSIAPEGSCSANVCSANQGGAHTVTATNSGKTATSSLTVSFVRNPGFEADLSGWNKSGSGTTVTLSRVAGGHGGGWAAQLTNTGSVATTYATLQDAPNWVTTTSAGTYVGSLWGRSDTAGAILKLKLQEYNGSTFVASAIAQTSLTTEWQEVRVSYTVRSPGSTLDLQAYVQNPAPGIAFYADDASIVYSP
jgi:parallel beta-helix repeat protein